MDKETDRNKLSDINHLLRKPEEQKRKSYFLKMLRTFTSVILIILAGFPLLVVFIYFPYKGFTYRGLPGLIIAAAVQVCVIVFLYWVVKRFNKRNNPHEDDCDDM